MGKPKFVLSDPSPFEPRESRREREPSLEQAYRDKKERQRQSRQNLDSTNSQEQLPTEDTSQLERQTSGKRRPLAKNVSRLQKLQGQGKPPGIRKQRSVRRSSSRQSSKGELVIDMTARFPEKNWFRQDSASVDHSNSRAMQSNQYLQNYLQQSY